MDLLIVVAIPFIIALLLALPIVRKGIPKDLQTYTITIVMLILFGILLRHFPEIEEHGAYIPPLIPWVSELGLNFSFYLDGLSLLFGLVVTGIGAVIFLYTGSYFDNHEKQSRFNMWLSAFTGAMLGLVLAGNLILMFIMWELTSITSYMLIGFYGKTSEDARVSAMRALLVTGGGGLALIAGIILLGAALGQTMNAAAENVTDETAIVTETEEGSIELPEDDPNGLSLTFESEDENVIPFRFEYTDLLSVDNLSEHPWFLAFALLIMIGAFTKSAQFPFHFWLPGAMSAPTPASAFLHSATMVKAGVYLLARLHPVMYQNPFWTNSLLTIGLITMFISALFAIKQRDLKGLLAYSTTSWLGTLVALIALPSFNGFKALAIGILAHALYKSALFLSVGSIDHSTGTRVIDNLGGMWKYMKGTGVVVILSALSMAGIPLLFGFVAKEVLLDATTHYMTATYLGAAAIWIVVISAALNGTAGYILIWDVFFRKPSEEIHYHAMPRLTVAGPMLLAIGGTTLLPFLLEPLIIPLVETVTPKEFELHLIPAWGTELQLSLLAIAVGLVIFAVRKPITANWNFLPFNGAQIYKRIIDIIDWLGVQMLRSQNGRIRYYLFYILGVIATILITSPMLGTIIRDSEQLAINTFSFSTGDVLDIMLIILAIGAIVISVIVKRHLTAALAVGIFGYAVGGIFIVGAAPDVALVQFLVETLSTVLIIVMISRISHQQRKKMADDLWSSTRVGRGRDAIISVIIGVSVFVFALTALTNRPERVSITEWHIENTYSAVGIHDIVAAIVTDFRGMDTFIEITVFAVAALGVLSILALNRSEEGVDVLPDNPNERVQTIPMSTPFTRTATYLIFPLALLIAFVHLFYGGNAPGDGFTAGIVGGLALALGFIVFGYYPMKDRIRWLHPLRFVSVGLLISIAAAVFPMLLGYAWMSHLEAKWFNFAGLHLTTTVIFELAIAVTVFGAAGIILESIAHPRDVEVLAGDEVYDPNFGGPITTGAPSSENES